jgi:hypothetical protein
MQWLKSRVAFESPITSRSDLVTLVHIINPAEASNFVVRLPDLPEQSSLNTVIEHPFQRTLVQDGRNSSRILQNMYMVFLGLINSELPFISRQVT